MHDLAALGGEELDIRLGEMHCVHGDEIRPRHPEPLQARQWTHRIGREALLELRASLLQVGLDRKVELPRVDDDFLPARIAHGVGRVRREREGEFGLVPPCVARGKALLQIRVGVRGVGRREVEHRQADESAYPGLPICARRRVREEVLICAAGDAAEQHLAGRDKRPVMHELG